MLWVFPKEVVEAVSLMTHQEQEPYLEYVKRLKSNDIARRVKISDLMHNSDITRLDVVVAKDLKRIEKYRAALEILNS